jgi:4-carboxymuconolactone decarboxylase
MPTRDEVIAAGRAMRATLGLVAPSSLAVVPGIEEYSTESIFGAIWSRPGLPLRERMLATLSSLSSLQRLQQLRRYTGAALNIGFTPEEVEEVFVHCSVHAGMPTAGASLGVAHEVFAERGVEPGPRDLPSRSLDESEALGMAVRSELFGDDDSPPPYLVAAAALQPEFATWTRRYAFGGIFQRPGLDARSRVVCSVASLAAMGKEAQLSAFVRAASRLGMTSAEIGELLLQIGPYAGMPASANAITVAARELSVDGDAR